MKIIKQLTGSIKKELSKRVIMFLLSIIRKIMKKNKGVLRKPVTIKRPQTTPTPIIPNIWTYERCLEVALLCNTRREFRNRHSVAYTQAGKNGWTDELTAHMF